MIHRGKISKQSDFNRADKTEDIGEERFLATDRRIIRATESDTGETWSVGTLPYAAVNGTSIELEESDDHIGRLLTTILLVMGSLTFLTATWTRPVIGIGVGGLFLLLGGLVWLMAGEKEDDLELTLYCASRDNVSYQFNSDALEWCETVVVAIGEYD
jgi:hypothetical protein